MNYIDLFHGILGFSLGAYWAGMHFENHYVSDIEPFAVELARQRFPESIQLGDIKNHKEWKLEPGEYIISGGFPCTDISVAGKGAGIHAERSGLWFEMRDVIRRVRPRFAIMENVGALTFRGLTDVLGSLAEIRYDTEWQDVRASDLGAPHRRERIWIVAYPSSGNAGSGAREQQGAESVDRESSLVLSDASRGSGETEAGGDNGKAMADTKRPEIWTGFGENETGEQDVPHGSGNSRCTGLVPDSVGKHDDDSGHGAGQVCRERPETTEVQRSIPNAPSDRRQQTGLRGQESSGVTGEDSIPNAQRPISESGPGRRGVRESDSEFGKISEPGGKRSQERGGEERERPQSAITRGDRWATESAIR